jgi:hypothetical protein
MIGRRYSAVTSEPWRAQRSLPPAVQQAALVEIIDEHFAHAAAGVDEDPLDAVVLADFLEASVEALDRLEIAAPRAGALVGVMLKLTRGDEWALTATAGSGLVRAIRLPGCTPPSVQSSRLILRAGARGADHGCRTD